jgi:hypothetical protein
MTIEERLSALGFALPAPPTPAGNYMGWAQGERLLLVGGNVGRLNGRPAAEVHRQGGRRGDAAASL